MMSDVPVATLTRAPGRLTRLEIKVIAACSAGTVFEWYDFILFGSLAGIIAQQFFSKAPPAIGLLFALGSFSAGFLVRPLGALVFGRLGDRIGRKYTFMATMVLMGAGTFAVGLVPGYDSIGWVAPAILVSLRLLQGLAVGGEYGGAVIYVAEHAAPGRRGAFTSWIQTTGTAGFLLSLLVVLAARLSFGEAVFADWGWRVPFLLSILLLAASVWIRLQLEESPVFARMKHAGTLSEAPLTEAFTRWANLRIVLVALFGLMCGIGVIWYCAQFYALLFLTQTLKVAPVSATLMVIIALTLVLPFFVLFGTLSDRIGRKPIVLTGIVLGGLGFFPIFHGLTHYANPALEHALANAPVVLSADPAECHFQLNLTGTARFTSPCDIAKARLAALSVDYQQQDAAAGSAPVVHVGDTTVTLGAGGASGFGAALGEAIHAAGYPAKADPAQVNAPMVVLLLFIEALFLTMAYGPVAALLVELFPSRIRYSSLSLPYHLGTGWFGGLAPTIAFALVALRGNIYDGLWFPVVVALTTAAIGIAFLRETKDNDITL